MNYSGDDMLRILAALSNPHRMRVIASLAHGANYVSQLARELEISRPLLQVHLRRLEAAGLVTSELRLSEEHTQRQLDAITAQLADTHGRLAAIEKSLTVID